MPVLPAFGGVASGSIMAPDTLMDYFYAPANPPVSYDIVNGLLDYVNLPGPITRRCVRPRSMVRSDVVGGTGAFDFIEEMASVSNEGYYPIPGGSISFYLHRNATLVLFQWQVGLVCDESITAASPSCSARFSVDGTVVSGSDRYVERTYDLPADTRWPGRDTFWSGHYAAHGASALTKGHHTATLSMFKSDNAVQMRARIRNMKYIVFF